MSLSPEQRFDRCLTEVLRHEGGYVNHPADPGGATNMGITHKTLADYRGRPVTRADVRALTRAEAAAIYRKNYWNRVRGDELPAGVDLMVFDLAVNSGTHRALTFLQMALGVIPDGVIGPITLRALREAQPVGVIERMRGQRERFYRSLTTFSTFGRGWLRRLSDVRAQALEWAS